MASQVPNHFVQQFNSNVQLRLQQEGSMLRQAVMTGSHKGEQASPVDQYGAISANLVTGRYNPMPNTEAPTDRRWVLPNSYDVNQLLDHFDMLKLLADPKSAYVQNAVNALGRAMDEEILAGIFGSNQTGKSGGTATAFATGQVVGVNQGAATATNLTVAKLREAKRLLMANQVNVKKEQIYCIINATNHDSLLAETQVISTDYNNKPVLVDGMVDQFLGIKFIHCELLSTGTDDQSGTSTQVPLFVKSGVYLGLWEDINTNVSQRQDLQGIPWQAYAKMSCGATRLEEKKVVKIWAR